MSKKKFDKLLDKAVGKEGFDKKCRYCKINEAEKVALLDVTGLTGDRRNPVELIRVPLCKEHLTKLEKGEITTEDIVTALYPVASATLPQKPLESE